MSVAAAARTAEGKYRTSEEVKARATEVYARWGLSLSDAINAFLVKSIDVGGLPFSMTTHAPSFDAVAARAYRTPLDDAGVPILPADWDDGDE